MNGDYNKDIEILESIKKYCEEIDTFIEGLDYNAFEETLTINRAVIFTLEQIGEKVKKLSHGFKSRYKDIPWQSIADMRNRIAHDYDGIYLDVVWDTIKEDLPELVGNVNKILDEVDTDSR